MKHSESIAAISKALCEFQKEITNPANTKENPFYKSNYAPLSDILTLIRPLLTKNGIAVLQDVESVGNDIKISTMITHIGGEWIAQEGMIIKLEKQTAQGAGSAITYGRRYMLSAMLGIASEDDDDGNGDAKKQIDNKVNAPTGLYSDFSTKINACKIIADVNTIKQDILEKNKNKWLTAKEFQGLMANVNIKLKSLEVSNGNQK